MSRAMVPGTPGGEKRIPEALMAAAPGRPIARPAPSPMADSSSASRTTSPVMCARV